MEYREADVCVVGAGFAGLAAAHYLLDKTRSANPPTVAVLEARDRVGGRVWNRPASDGTVVSAGGTWLGRGQERMFDLVHKVGLTAYPQYIGDVDPNDPDNPLNPRNHYADTILRLDGVNHRYQGLLAPIGDAALAVLALALEQLNAIAATVPIGKPWETPNAHSLDSQTLGEWVASSLNVPVEKAQLLLRTSLSTLFSCDPAEVSLLGSMLLARGGGEDGFQYYIDSTITETHLVDGGAPEVARRLGEALGDALRLSTPVRRIGRGDDHVAVFGDGITVRAKYVIVTAPPIVASQLEYDPPLPAAHSQLLRKMPPGAIWKFVTVYDTPFWRAKGLTGQTTAPQSPVPVSIDASPKSPADGSQPKGELACFAVGKMAIELERMGPEKRKALVLSELALRLDDEAAHPIGYSETNWSTEQWTLGGMIGHFPTGVLTSYGAALHEPAGRIYWAGTERATQMHGLMEGAVRSGEQAARDVIRELNTGRGVTA
jgi:monoamine oxidase